MPLGGLIATSRRIAASGWGGPGLFTLSMAESTVLPVPLELVLIPHMAANRDRIWRLATIALLGCLAGATLGYLVGMALFDTLGQWLIDRLGWAQGVTEFTALFEAHGFWAIIAIGVLPIPFQAAMLLAGASGYPFVLFLLAAALSRGARYYGLAAVVWWLGPVAETVWRRHARPVGVALTLIVLAAVALIILGDDPITVGAAMPTTLSPG